jgi:hypothetical protein
MKPPNTLMKETKAAAAPNICKRRELTSRRAPQLHIM